LVATGFSTKDHYILGNFNEKLEGRLFTSHFPDLLNKKPESVLYISHRKMNLNFISNKANELGLNSVEVIVEKAPKGSTELAPWIWNGGNGFYLYKASK